MAAERVQGPPWLDPGWAGEADRWILSALESVAPSRRGAIEHVRDRPWAAVARISTDSGS